ncbi:trypsin-like serine protease [uncultured Vibrio sp.]|uniref:trypsin-like serine protease n=1 Tax=uncultured Vibrio sp. TaxID=114054 RepID=UPI00261DB4C9|nr:trypsin-like serine protease [uncultured Vibrio sp.]
MMLRKTSIAVGVLTVLTSLNASAVRMGTDVAEADYRDHTVRFEVSTPGGITSTCGGLLISGEYILTAGHCTGDSAYTSNYSEYLPWLDSGASNSITVFKGVERYTDGISTTYSNLDVYGTFESAYNAIMSELAYIESVHGASKFASQYFWYDLNWSRISGQRDIALIQLSEKIPQQHQAAIKPIFDSISETFYLETGDTFTFRGWGYDETNSTPTVMQETTLELPFTPNRYNPNKPVDSLDVNVDCDSSTAECEYRTLDKLIVKPIVVGGTASSGDSGTPMVLNGNALMLASSEAGGHTENGFTNIGLYLENIATAINKVTAPSEMIFDIDDNTTNSITSTFKIQNLTQFTDYVAPSLTGDTDNFTITGCNVSLDTYESCELTLTVNPNGVAQSNDSNAELYLNDTNNTIIPISSLITKELPEDNDGSDEPENNDGSSGGSSGGSTGLFSLFGLLALTRLRKSK